MNDTLFEFSKRIAYLDERIKKLQDSVSASRASSLESEVNTCEAYLREHIYGYSQRHGIDTKQYHFQLLSVQSRLEAVKMFINTRKDRSPSREGGLWQRVVGVVLSAIGFVTDMLGIGSIVRSLLSAGKEPPKLTG
jgi:hypothetical protein